MEPVLVKVHSHSDAISQLCWFPPLINTIIIIISKFIFAGLVMGRWRRRKAPKGPIWSRNRTKKCLLCNDGTMGIVLVVCYIVKISPGCLVGARSHIEAP